MDYPPPTFERYVTVERSLKEWHHNSSFVLEWKFGDQKDVLKDVTKGFSTTRISAFDHFLLSLVNKV